MPWQDQLHSDPLPWLSGANAPGVRYLALRVLQHRRQTWQGVLRWKRIAAELDQEEWRIPCRSLTPGALAHLCEGFFVLPIAFAVGPAYN